MTLLNLKMVFTLAVFGAWFYHITAHEGEGKLSQYIIRTKWNLAATYR